MKTKNAKTEKENAEIIKEIKKDLISLYKDKVKLSSLFDDLKEDEDNYSYSIDDLNIFLFSLEVDILQYYEKENKKITENNYKNLVRNYIKMLTENRKIAKNNYKNLIRNYIKMLTRNKKIVIFYIIYYENKFNEIY